MYGIEDNCPFNINASTKANIATTPQTIANLMNIAPNFSFSTIFLPAEIGVLTKFKISLNISILLLFYFLTLF